MIRPLLYKLAAGLLALSACVGFPRHSAAGTVYPDSAEVRFNWEVDHDTVTVSVRNLSSSDLQGFFLTDITGYRAELVACQVDSVAVADVPCELHFGNIVSGRYTNRWLIGSITDSLRLRYYVSSYSGGNMSWAGVQPFAVFAVGDSASQSCCTGIRGNIDGDPDDQIDVSDLLRLVNYLFASPPAPQPPCFDEADVDGTGVLDFADIMHMVAHMFCSPTGPPPLECP